MSTLDLPRRQRVMPLDQLHPRDQARIADEVAQDRPPARWRKLGDPDRPQPLAQIESRGWWEWHWQRGIDPDKRRTSLPAWLRAAVIARDGLSCALCWLPVDRSDVHIDHIHPVAHGGTDDPNNLQVTHSLCNLRKGART